MTPSHQQKATDTINIEPVQKTRTQVVEYLEYLKVLDGTDKKSEMTYMVRASQKIRPRPNSRFISLRKEVRKLIRGGKGQLTQIPPVKERI